MILFAILFVMLFLLIAFIILVASVGGTILTIVFADVIVCIVLIALVIFWLIKRR